MSCIFPPHEKRERYFSLCQQFIYFNIKDVFVKNMLIQQLVNYYEDFPDDLEVLFLMWIRNQPVVITNLLDLKTKTYPVNKEPEPCVFFSKK